MRPSAPNLTTYLSSFIKDPSSSPTRLESPIDTIAQYLSTTDQDNTTGRDQEFTPIMNYASLPGPCSPLLQHQREQQLDDLQSQQCIPGLAQIYAPLPVTSPSLALGSAFTASTSSLITPLSRSSSAAFDDPDPDSDYVPGCVAISSSRKRANSPTQPFTRASTHTNGDSSPPPPKRQRAAPSGPISTRDWVPPDVSGLNKREARLVKNRAAAFLSRQRKREEFEAMEARVHELEAENARLRQNAQLPSSSSSPFSLTCVPLPDATPSLNPKSHTPPVLPSAQPSSDELFHQQQREYQKLLAQLSEAREREEALAAQLRDAQASLSRQQQPSPQYGIPHWPAVSNAATAVVKTEAMDEDGRLPHQQPVPLRLSSQNARDDDSDRDDDAQAVARRKGRKEKEQLVREKGSGSVAFMVLLFSLSLLSGGQDRGNTGTTKNPSQFSFRLPTNSGSGPAFDIRMQQQIKEEDEENISAKRWATLDALDDEFDYFSRQHHVVPSSTGSSFDASSGDVVDFGFGGLGLGLGLGLDNGFGYSDMGDAMAYPSLNTLGSPFSVASSSLPSTSPSSISTSSRHRAVSPSTTSSSGASTVTSAFNRQVEVSISTSPSSLSKQENGVSFDLKLAGGVNNGEDDDSLSNSATSAGSEKTVTVHVRKVPSPSASSPSSNGKNTILLELTTSSLSGPNSSSDELEALNADFEALLGGGLAIPGELGDAAAQSSAQWRLGLAPRDAF